MNAFKRISFRQKMFKGAMMMIIILLQTGCATQFSLVGREPHDWNAPNSSKLAASDAASSNAAQGNHINAQTTSITGVANQDVRRVRLKNDSGIRKGEVLGFLIGAGTGAIIGFALGDDPECSESGGPLVPCLRFTAEAKAAILGILGGVAGAIVGGIVEEVADIVTAKSDKAIHPAMNHDFSALTPLAQFPEQELERLTVIK